MVNGRARFVNKVDTCFANFISLYKEHEEEWREFLTDFGKGEPPLEYLVAFEEGLRNYGDDMYALGTHPL